MIHALALAALLSRPLRPSVTWYAPDGRAANGRTYGQNARRGFFCASNRYPLGTRLLLTSRGGRRVVVTVCDRIGHGSDCDLSESAAARLMGERFRRVGRVSARVRVVGSVRVQGQSGRGSR